jgi:hypothetical protein
MNSSYDKIILFIKIFLSSVLIATFLYYKTEQPLATAVLFTGLITAGIVAARDRVKRNEDE